MACSMTESADPRDDRPALWREAFDLERQIKGHASQPIVDGLNIIGRAADIFLRNTIELRQLLEAAVRSDELAAELFQNVRPPVARVEFLAQVDQRLHNYVAALKSLVEHTRKQVRKLYGSDAEFLVQYRKNVVQPFAESPVAMFLQDLRDFVLHNGLPLTGAHVTITESRASGEVLLDTAALLRWRGWTDEAKTYLNQAGERALLRDAVDEYSAIYQRSYGWLNQAQTWRMPSFSPNDQR
jgi:hypothetical protein